MILNKLLIHEYIYIYRERERETDRQTDRQRERISERDMHEKKNRSNEPNNAVRYYNCLAIKHFFFAVNDIDKAFLKSIAMSLSIIF